MGVQSYCFRRDILNFHNLTFIWLLVWNAGTHSASEHSAVEDKMTQSPLSARLDETGLTYAFFAKKLRVPKH